jgi:organic hydroperoxide reductase OsmC/OhrA
MTTHRYRSRLAWQGSTGTGYAGYQRTHRVTTPPAGTELTISSDPAFLGDPTMISPEQLVLAAASSCQLLSFLAVAARARIDVLSYQDDAEAVMPEDDQPVRITDITLRPRITVSPGTSLDRVRRLVELAHRECYVANSLITAIHLDPTIIHQTTQD